MKAIPFVVGALCACRPSPSSAPPPPATSVAPAAATSQPGAEDGAPRWLAFRAYPGAREVCSQSVMGSGMEIHWTLYATGDPIAKVRAFYGAALTKDEVRSGADDILAVHEKGTAYPTCDREPDATAQTVFIVSRASR